MAGTKPKTADGYSPDVTAACESTLLTLLGAFGTLKGTLRLVGGLVPRYLTPETPPDVPAHAGTSDVDIVLNLQVLAAGQEYASLADQLGDRGFSRFVNSSGAVSSWQWQIRVNEHISVVVEFLRGAEGDRGVELVSVEGERVSALSMPFMGIVDKWFQEHKVTGPLLDGGGMSTEIIRIADVPAFIILKALALDNRMQNKDASDLIHVLRYAGDLEYVAKLMVEREVSGDYPGAVDAGIAALRKRFCDNPDDEGYLKVGPVGYAAFHVMGDEEERIREQRFAAGLVEKLVAMVDAMLAERRAS
ncbi:hypothetical protein EVC45_43125 [Paraburkholderia sp. UYCP14C]|uniref:hypothetical protein n=1 Tax=Paraburkholderia sp. UYCP14C TaxID=2511130 RepID=UPI0010212FF0|nr:hypothetical protein [Paraburkholderia sp. UYCP14C]RZF23659.1 hypothetical protein EVC45_43125 [Paraburkholderia sp. UYCP14C]